MLSAADPRFAAFEQLDDDNENPGTEAGPSSQQLEEEDESNGVDDNDEPEEEEGEGDVDENGDAGEKAFDDELDSEGLAGPSSGKVVKPLTPEALAAFNAAQERTGVIYISRIPPGMRPTKVRHLMSAYGEIGRVYLQQEDAKRAYLRKKFTATKKAHFTEGWVEFADKKVARSVAAMLNAEPIGGKKGTRWRDDVWTMKYLPRFKWNMLTEAIAHESAERTARLRVELEQSRKEQKEYLHNVELARVLDKRAKRKRESGKDDGQSGQDETSKKAKVHNQLGGQGHKPERKQRKAPEEDKAKQLQTVLSSIF